MQARNKLTFTVNAVVFLINLFTVNSLVVHVLTLTALVLMMSAKPKEHG